MAYNVYQFSAAPVMSSDVLFRALFSQVSAGIAAAGLVQTADPQVNWATVTLPAGGATTVKEMWRFNDAAQATDPIFVQIIYARGSSLTQNPMMQIKVGTGSDGAGNLTSAPNTNVSVTNANPGGVRCDNTATSPLGTGYVCGDGSCIFISLMNNWNGVATNGGIFGLERLRDANGAPISGAFICYWNGEATSTGSGASTVTAQCVYTHNFFAQPSQGSGIGWGLSMYSLGGRSSGSEVLTGYVNVMPAFTGASPRLGGPSVGLVMVSTADSPVGSTFQISHYGATHTFLVTGGIGSFDCTSNVTTHAAALRID